MDTLGITKKEHKLMSFLMCSKIGDNVHRRTTLLCTLFSDLLLLTILFTPKHLKLAAGGGLIGGFFNNLLEGYRTPVPIKITQNPPIQKPIKQGGANKGEA